MALVGLDIGTSGCKSTIFDIEGNICSYAYKEYGIETDSSGKAELNADDVFKAVKYVLGMSVKKYKGEKITALSVSSFGESAVPVDNKGRVLHNSLLYTDKRGTVQCERLINKLGLENIMDITGVRAHPMYTVNKLMWFKENMDELYKKVWKFMLYEDFILFKLGHEPVIDYSLASRTMAFNITDKKWSNNILEAAGINEKLFSSVASPGTVIGNINRSIAEEIGLPLDTKLVTGGHDQVCAAVGAGIIKGRKAVDGIGTVECITPAFDQPVANSFMLENNFACVPHAKEGMYVTYAFNFTGGALLKWYRDNFAAAEIEQAKKTGESVYKILDQKTDEEPTDILVLPHFAGAGTPYMDVNSKGAIVGLSFDKTSGHLYKAMLEGVTYEMMYNIECLARAGVDIDELRAVGGGAKSDVWLQLKADMTGKKVSNLNVDEAGTLGTAIIAGTATKVYKNMEDAVNKLVKIRKVYNPNIKKHEIYLEQYDKYKRMYSRVKEIIS
jgi:xylulokinase